MSDDTSSRHKAAGHQPDVPKTPHFAPKAKAVIPSVHERGPSQVRHIRSKTGTSIQTSWKPSPWTCAQRRANGRPRIARRSSLKSTAKVESNEAIVFRTGEMLDDVSSCDQFACRRFPNHEPSLMLDELLAMLSLSARRSARGWTVWTRQRKPKLYPASFQCAQRLSNQGRELASGFSAWRLFRRPILTASIRKSRNCSPIFRNASGLGRREHVANSTYCK